VSQHSHSTGTIIYFYPMALPFGPGNASMQQANIEPARSHQVQKNGEKSKGKEQSSAHYQVL